MARRYADQGLAVMQGFRMGQQAMREFLQDRKNAEVSGQIADVNTDFTPRETPVASGDEALTAGRQAFDNAMANAQTEEQRTKVQADYAPTLQALEAQKYRPASVVNSLGVGSAFRQRNTAFSPQEVDQAKSQARVGIYQNAGREEDAARVLTNASRSRELADQDELRTATAVPSRAQSVAASGIGMDELTGGAQPTTANTPARMASKGVPALLDGLDYYLKDAAPRAIQLLVQQGRIAEAKQYADFLESRDGQQYAKLYTRGLRQFAVGDHAGALSAFEKLYNSDLYPDGHRVKLTALEGGQMRIDQIDAKGNIIGSKVGEISTLTEEAALALNPLEATKFIAEQQGRRKTEGALLDRQLQIESVRQRGREVQEDRRDDRLNKRLGAQSEQLDRRLQAQADRGLTAAQDRSNAEIDAAREAIAGLSPQEIMRRTARADHVGRENRDYDPFLARQAVLANRRKIGDDPVFDQRLQAKPAAAAGRADIAKRFRADKSMQSRTLGADTPHGVEVWEKGKLIGYFR